MGQNVESIGNPPVVRTPSRVICIAAAVLAAMMGAWAGGVYAIALDRLPERMTLRGPAMILGLLLGGVSGYVVGLWWRRAVAGHRSNRRAWRIVLRGAALGLVAGAASTFVLHCGLSTALLLIAGRLEIGELPIGIIWSFAGFLGCGAGVVLGALGGAACASSLGREEVAR